MEYDGNGDTSCNWCTWKGDQRLGKETLGEVEMRVRIETMELQNILIVVVVVVGLFVLFGFWFSDA